MPSKKDSLISSLKNTISFLKFELKSKQFTINSLTSIIKELVSKSKKTHETLYENKSQQTDVVTLKDIDTEITEHDNCKENNIENVSEVLSSQRNTSASRLSQPSPPLNQSLNDKTDTKYEEHLIQNERLLRQLQEQIDIQKNELDSFQQENREKLQFEKKIPHSNYDKEKNIIIFGDSIPKGINRNMLNRKLSNAKCSYKFFSGATSRDFYHYIKPALLNPEQDYDVAILHMGVNDLLNLGSNAETVANSIINIANQCKTMGVADVIVSSITFTTLLPTDLLQCVNEEIKKNVLRMVITLLKTVT